MLASNPASILNHISPETGIPRVSFRVKRSRMPRREPSRSLAGDTLQIKLIGVVTGSHLLAHGP